MTTKRLPAEKRRLQILKSAIRVFARSTYHGATTKSISEEAGVTEALIYRYYGSKRALFTEAIDYTSQKIADDIGALLKKTANSPVDAIYGCFDYYVRILNRSDDFAKIVFLVLAELDQDDVRKAYLPHQSRVLKALTDAITTWQEQGLVTNEVEITSTAWLFFGTYLILALYKHSHGNIELNPSYAMLLAKPYLTPACIEQFEQRFQK